MMNIYYKIVEVWPNDHLIVARYWTDLISEEFLASDDQRNDQGKPIRCRSDVAITLPIPAPQGEELDKLIVTNAPRDWLIRMEKIVDPNVDTSLDHISDMLGTEYTKTKAELDTMIPTGTSVTDADIEELINNIHKI